MGDCERSDLREAPPLGVDLDGTLITRDLLRESGVRGRGGSPC